MTRLSRSLVAVLCLFLVLPLLPFVAHADMGPKPSVRVQFTGLGEEECYATLLSKHSSTGPESAWNGEEERANPNRLPEEIWRAFVDYADFDGYYFLQVAWQISEADGVAWTYYPPDDFKVLLYFPEDGRFLSTEVLHRYAFDTYYTVVLEGDSIGSAEYDGAHSTDDRLNVHRSYLYRYEILAFLVRLCLTLVIELGLALLFGMRGGRLFGRLLLLNLGTQIFLNLALNLVGNGRYFVAWGFALEAVIFVIEAVVASLWVAHASRRERPPLFYVTFALLANALSFTAGLFLSAYAMPFAF